MVVPVSNHVDLGYISALHLSTSVDIITASDNNVVKNGKLVHYQETDSLNVGRKLRQGTLECSFEERGSCSATDMILVQFDS